MNAFKPGDRILGRWEGGAYWWAGRVHSLAGDSIAIQYDDGTSEIRGIADVRPFDWVTGSKVEAVWSGDGNWYAARIMEANEDGSAFTVRFEDDGTREEVAAGRIRSFL